MSAAQLVDVERGRRTMMQYLRHLKSLDPVVHRRNVMERDEDGEDTGRRVRARHGYGELEQLLVFIKCARNGGNEQGSAVLYIAYQ
eukprot:3970412-Ditylum_brightwellii.AAC.1